MRDTSVAYRVGNVIIPQFVLTRVYREGLEFPLFEELVEARRQEFYERGLVEAYRITNP